MLGLHRRVFNDDVDEEDRVSFQGESHNKKVLKVLMAKSPISLLMMVIILLMFILCEITDMYHGKFNLSVISAYTLLKYGANSNKLVNLGEYWRLFTAMFLHGGGMHLIANSSSFFLYLMPVEQRTRSRYLYLLILLGGGMLGNILSDNIYNIRGKALLAVGASTSISSVVGFDIAKRILKVDNQQLQSRRISITLLYMLIISIMPGVDFFGHFGSLFAGFLIGIAFLKGNDNYMSLKKIKIIRILGILGLSLHVSLMLGLLFYYQY